MQKESATFAQVKDIKTKFSVKATDNSIVTVTRLDGSDFMLFLSPKGKKDRMFVKKLKALWQQHKNK